jgi:hypothetical protein
MRRISQLTAALAICSAVVSISAAAHASPVQVNAVAPKMTITGPAKVIGTPSTTHGRKDPIAWRRPTVPCDPGPCRTPLPPKTTPPHKCDPAACRPGPLPYPGRRTVILLTH